MDMVMMVLSNTMVGVVALGVLLVSLHRLRQLTIIKSIHVLLACACWWWSVNFDKTLAKKAPVVMDTMTEWVAVSMSFWAWVCLVSVVLAYAKPMLRWQYYVWFMLLFAVLGGVSVQWTHQGVIWLSMIGYAVGVVGALLLRLWVQYDTGTTNYSKINEPVFPVFNLHSGSDISF